MVGWFREPLGTGNRSSGRVGTGSREPCTGKNDLPSIYPGGSNRNLKSEPKRRNSACEISSQAIPPASPTWKVWAQNEAPGYFTDRVHLWVVWEELEYKIEPFMKEEINHMIGSKPCIRLTGVRGYCLIDIEDRSGWNEESDNFLGYEDRNPAEWTEETKTAWQQKAEDYVRRLETRRAQVQEAS